MGKALTNTHEIISHLVFYAGQDESGGNQVIRQCFTELLNAHPNIDEIVENMRPYGDDAILVLVEALNLPGNKTFNLQPNAMHVLEKIINSEAVSLILDNFNDYIERFDFSLTGMLMAIIAREGKQTKGLVMERYIQFLIVEMTFPIQ